MITYLRIRLARWILGDHCPCYRMGYHNLCDSKKLSKDAIARQRARKE
jgi:hypothetical protein